MADELRKRLKRIRLAKDQPICFLSHHKATGGVVARLLHDRICEILNVPSSAVFLDSNDLGNLANLQEQVSRSSVLCLLQTGTVLTRPYVLVEVYTALKKNIPIVGVTVEGSGYDFEATAKFLRSPDFKAALEEVNPGSSELIEELGIDLQEMGKLLGDKVPKVISSRLSPHENDRVLNASIEVLIGRILGEIEARAAKANPGMVSKVGGDVEKQEE